LIVELTVHRGGHRLCAARRKGEPVKALGCLRIRLVVPLAICLFAGGLGNSAYADTLTSAYQEPSGDASITGHSVLYQPGAQALSTAGQAVAVTTFDFHRLVSLGSEDQYVGAHLQVEVLSGTKLCISATDTRVMPTITEVPPVAFFLACSRVHRGENVIDIDRAVLGEHFDQDGFHTLVYGLGADGRHEGNAKIAGTDSIYRTFMFIDVLDVSA
jgi:hypothetical protein